MKCSELMRILRRDGWIIVSQRGSHIHLKHPSKRGKIVFPYHGSNELGKGMEIKIKKIAGL